MRRIAFALPTLVLFLLARRAEAQDLGFVTEIFKEVHSITIYLQASELDNSSELGPSPGCFLDGLCGAGTEVLFDLTSPRGAHIELGLGASYGRGLKKDGRLPELHGGVRSFPTLSAYGSFENPELAGIRIPLDPYLGLNFGLAELWNAQAYDAAGHEYGIKGQTFEWGFTAGIYVDIPVFEGLFVEGGYRRKRFSSLDYTFPGALEDQDALPDTFPRELDISGWQLAVGWQFKLRKEPPSYPGTWLLSKYNDQALPGLVSQTAPGAQGATRKEVVTGMLELDRERGRYTLASHVRTSTVNSDGKQIAVAPLTAEVETGTYSVNDDGDLCLTPTQSPGRSYCSTRVGEEILLRPLDGSVFLQFRKVGS